MSNSIFLFLFEIFHVFFRTGFSRVLLIRFSFMFFVVVVVVVVVRVYLLKYLVLKEVPYAMTGLLYGGCSCEEMDRQRLY